MDDIAIMAARSGRKRFSICILMAGKAGPVRWDHGKSPSDGRDRCKADAFQMSLKRTDIGGWDNCAHIAIRPDKNPVIRFDAIRLTNVAVAIHDIALRSNRVDMQARTRLYRGKALHSIAKQRPVAALIEVEQPFLLTSTTANGRIRRPVAGKHAIFACWTCKIEGGIWIAEVKLMHFTATPHRASLCRIQQFPCKAQHAGGYRPPLGFVTVQQRSRRPAKDSSELPSEIIGVLNTGIQPLPPVGGCVCAASPARKTRPLR